MKRLPSFRLAAIGLMAMILFSSVKALASTNTVPPTQLGDFSLLVNLNDKKPAACEGWFLTGFVSGSGTITGTSGNDLIVGSTAADIIDGQGGDDCILGGGGDDQISGGDGSDVCLGGPDNDTFITCEGETQ